ncbi:heat shock 70 kDa protein 12A-like isoform X2 [Saccostrea cucullata]
MRWIFACCLLFLSADSSKNTKSCPESTNTIKYVPSCPTTEEDWNLRAKAKNCSSVKQKCTSAKDFVYHCVINSYANSTIEVCAPSVSIIGHSCVEFNMRGSLIQESPYNMYNCKYPQSCPFRYNSTDVYKYQSCFAISKLQDKENCSHCIDVLGIQRNQVEDTSSCNEMIWQIVALIATIIIVTILAIWFYIYRNVRSRGKEEGFIVNWKPENEYMELNEGQTCKEIDSQSKHCETEFVSSESSLTKDIQNGVDDRYIVSIEISNSYFGWATQDLKDRRHINVKDEGRKDNPTRKQPTSILLAKDEELFGYEALQSYIKKTRECTFYHKMEKIALANTGSEMCPKRIYRKILNYIADQVFDEANHESKECARKPKDIEFIITIPSYWKDEDLGRILEDSVKKSKINKESARWKLVTKAEVVSPFLHEVKADVLCQNFNVDHLSFEEGTKYAILDIGSTACELTILVSSKKGPDCVCGKPYRKKWGEGVDQSFSNMINIIIGDDEMNTFQMDNSGEFQKLFFSFESLKTKKSSFKSSNLDGVELLLPTALHSLIREKKIDVKTSIEKNVNKTKISADLISWIDSGDKSCFRLKVKAMEAIFKQMLDDIDKTIEDHFSQDKNCEMKCVCVIGGYANCKLVQKKVREKFKLRTVVIPKNADLVVAKGAVYYGYKYCGK